LARPHLLKHPVPYHEVAVNQPEKRLEIEQQDVVVLFIKVSLQHRAILDEDIVNHRVRHAPEGRKIQVLICEQFRYKPQFARTVRDRVSAQFALESLRVFHRRIAVHVGVPRKKRGHKRRVVIQEFRQDTLAAVTKIDMPEMAKSGYCNARYNHSKRAHSRHGRSPQSETRFPIRRSFIPTATGYELI
jgi:hypothetical protein